MQSDAKTVAEYLSNLDDVRREAISAVRGVILDNLPDGYEEAMQFGMITYVVPLSVLADTYNGQPLMYVALASQKRHMSLYLTNVYGDESVEKWFQGALPCGGQEARHGQVMRSLQEARRPAARLGRRSRRQDAHRRLCRRSTRRPGQAAPAARRLCRVFLEAISKRQAVLTGRGGYLPTGAAKAKTPLSAS